MSSATPPSRPLLKRFPGLALGLPFLPLANLPTTVRAMDRLGTRLDAGQLWVKDDGASAAVYGGNKVRKLEFLLGAARAAGARAVLTFGYAGSNHATATAVHAASLGMRAVSMLLPQQNAPYLRRNLLVSAAVGTELHELPSRAALVASTALAIARHRLADGRSPFVIAPGGSSPLGTVGFVNAAFELAAQAEAGVAPMPARIYAAAGSLGTVVGLGIGLAAVGAETRVVAVRVVDENYVNPARTLALWRRTVRLLRGHDPSFPEVGDIGDRIELRGEFFGEEYAATTREGEEAERLAAHVEGLVLDRTYTAKALACLVADLRGSRAGEGPLLFWNTCNGVDLSDLASKASPDDLPRRLRRYFASGEDAGR